MSSAGDMSTTLRLGTTADTSGAAAMQSQLAALQQQIMAVATQMQQLGSVSTSLANAISNLGKASTEEQSALSRSEEELKKHTDATDKAKDSGDALTNTLAHFSNQIVTSLATYFSFQAALNLIGDGFTAITNAAEMAISRMEQFLEQSFQLSTEAQQMEYLWGYQYGGPQGGGPQIAAQLQAWIPNFAMNSPYTMMQIMGAVGPLSQLGLSFQGLQRFLPLISDLAATHTSIFGGGGMLPLPYAALAVMEATKGYSRRLLMELQIRPNELEPYGLKFVGDKQSGQIANPEMFLPALEAYAKDKGYTGASAKMAHESVTGLWASLQDRQQSFMRRLMGEDIPDPNAGKLGSDVLAMIAKGDIAGAMKATGADQASLKSYGVTFGMGGGLGAGTTIQSFQDALEKFSEDKFYAGRKDTPEFRQGTIFSVILKGMQDFSKWWDDHQSTFDKISKFVADVGGKLLDVGRQGAGSFLDAFAGSFSKRFVGAQWQGLGNDFMQWISDPKNQESLKQAGDYIGTNLAEALTNLGSGLDHLRQGWDSLPDDWKKNGGNLLGGALNTTVQLMQDLVGALSALGAALQAVGDWSKDHDFFALWNNEMEKSGKLAADLGELMIDFKKIMSGDVDTSAIMTAINNIRKDMQNLLDTSTNADGNHGGTHPTPGGAKGKPTGHGHNVDPNAYARSLGPNVTQNNTYNIQGATSMDLQTLINMNNRKVSNVQNRLYNQPGFLNFNAVGLF